MRRNSLPEWALITFPLPSPWRDRAAAQCSVVPQGASPSLLPSTWGDVMRAPGPPAHQTSLGTDSLPCLNLCAYQVSTTAPLGFATLIQHDNNPQVLGVPWFHAAPSTHSGDRTDNACWPQPHDGDTTHGSLHQQKVTEAE